MLNGAVVGATGYTGVELAKLLLAHPRVKLTVLTTRQKDSIPLGKLLPNIPQAWDFEITPFSFQEVVKKADVIFLCLPHTEAMEAADKFRKAGKVVIDLSADFRIKNKRTYEKWYGVKHRFSKRLGEAVYGLSEIYRDEIRRSDLIANPGCYPTGPLLAMIPLFQEELINPDSIIINAASGVSGAGKKLSMSTQFCETQENFSAYKVNQHPHMPEIEEILSQASPKPVQISFVPHLLPLSRGIFATIYLEKTRTAKANQIRKALINRYQNELFVRIKPEGEFPSLKDVQNTNFCDIGIKVDDKSGRVILITAIDNLVKGASGQALQNMNIRFGFPEGEGFGL